MTDNGRFGRALLMKVQNNSGEGVEVEHDFLVSGDVDGDADYTGQVTFGGSITLQNVLNGCYPDDHEVGGEFSGDANGDTDAFGQTVTFSLTDNTGAGDWLI